MGPALPLSTLLFSSHFLRTSPLKVKNIQLFKSGLVSQMQLLKAVEGPTVTNIYGLVSKTKTQKRLP